jgi:AcrR family transcriptional regulator
MSFLGGRNQQPPDTAPGPATRRRGAELEAAILEAAWDELAEVGYAALTMEGVAARAKTSRAVLYRRWPTRPDLVVAALKHRTDFTKPGSFDTGSLRGDMLALLRHMSTRVGEIAGVLSFLIAASFEEAGMTPALLRERATAGEPSAVPDMLRRAAARGEIGPGQVSPRIANVAVDLVRHDMIMKQTTIPDGDLETIVDEVFLPLVRSASERDSNEPNVNEPESAFGRGS